MQDSIGRFLRSGQEEQLEAILRQSEASAILKHRYRLPRSLLKELFLRLFSERVFHHLLENLQADQQGKPLPYDFHWMEFADQNMARVFDPIWVRPTLEAEHELLVPFTTRFEDDMRQAIRQQLNM